MAHHSQSPENHYNSVTLADIELKLDVPEHDICQGLTRRAPSSSNIRWTRCKTLAGDMHSFKDYTCLHCPGVSLSGYVNVSPDAAAIWITRDPLASHVLAVRLRLRVAHCGNAAFPPQQGWLLASHKDKDMSTRAVWHSCVRVRLSGCTMVQPSDPIRGWIRDVNLVFYPKSAHAYHMFIMPVLARVWCRWQPSLLQLGV